MDVRLCAGLFVLLSVTGNEALSKKPSNANNGICCGGKIMPFAKDKVFRSTDFDWRTEICCQGKILKLPVDDTKSGSGLLATLLASASIRQPFFGSPYSCCGNTFYDHEKELCCAGKVHKIPPEVPDDRRVRPFPTMYGCCKDQFYNLSSHDCCQGTVLKKSSPDEFCCGERLLDYAQFICCKKNYSDTTERPGVFRRDRPDIGCCGSGKFYYDRSMCCTNKVIPLSNNLEDRWNSLCCGGRLFDGRNRNLICCENRIMKKAVPRQTCCKEKLYDLRDQLCCDGRLQPQNENGTLQCPLLPISPCSKISSD